MKLIKNLIHKIKIIFSNNTIIWDKCPIKNKMFQQIADSTVRIAHDTLIEYNYYNNMVVHDSVVEEALWDAYINFSVYVWQIPQNYQNEYFDTMYENLLKLLEQNYGYTIID